MFFNFFITLHSLPCLKLSSFLAFTGVIHSVKNFSGSISILKISISKIRFLRSNVGTIINFFLIEPVLTTFESHHCLHCIGLFATQQKHTAKKLNYFFKVIFLKVSIFTFLFCNKLKDIIFLKVHFPQVFVHLP